MIENLKDLKDTYESTRLQIDKAKEPLEELVKIQAHLSAVLADTAGFLERFKEDKEGYLKFFMDEFTMGTLKRIVRERSKDEKVSSAIS
jgi:hypothetical protein